MKYRYLYTLLICILFYGCKHDTSKCPKCPECTRVHVDDFTTPITANTFLALSDVHIDGKLTKTQFGCNSVSVSNNTLWQRTETKIDSVVTHQKPKFMVYLGDLPGYDHSQRKENAHLMIENLRNLDLGIPILYLPGNNDSLKGDYHSFSTSSVDINTVLTYKAKPKDSLPVINPITATTTVNNIDFKKEFGYYSADIIITKDTLKVIALNTVIFCSDGSHYTEDDGVSQQKAAQDQMTWFEGKLDSLSANDRVLIMMHIPIGKDSFTGHEMWKNDLDFIDASGKKHTLYNGFLDLIAAHQPKIVGLLNGHTHIDGLRRLYKSDDKSKMTAFSVSTPGIAVNHGNNPAFKTFTYDPATFNLLDFKTFYATPSTYVPVPDTECNNKHKHKHKHADTLHNTDFKFMNGSSYTFKQMYTVSNPAETMFTTLAKQSNDTLVKYVNSTLGAKSNRNIKLKHTEALNVYKN